MKDEDNTGQVDMKEMVEEKVRILSVNKGVSTIMIGNLLVFCVG